MSIEADYPHPREREALVGQHAAATTLLQAARSGRLHHAWLIGGPEGVGKATLAYRFARYLLAPAGERTGGEDGLAIDPSGRTARQVSAQSHPNLIAVERAAAAEGKAAPKVVTVDAIRKALGFFTSTAADGGRRICIVDAVDDLNVQAANALLKTVEEPPPGALILLVSHAPDRILPTIRSRCRKLTLPLLRADALHRLVAELGTGQDRGLADRAVALADGSARRALAFLDPDRIALIDELDAVLATLPEPAPKRILALADRLGDRRGGADDLPIVLDTVQRWLSAQVERRMGAGPARLAPLAEVCENVAEAARALEIYNLDRRAFIVSTFGDLAEAVRRAA